MKPLPQYLRGIAAVLVVLYHANLKLLNSVYHTDMLAEIGHGAGLAFVGVNLFFALSGYLMASLVRKSSIGQFIWHRAARIYPAYFIAVGIIIGLSLMFSGTFPPIYLPALTLFPTRGYGPLQVDWSLTYEITFYVISAVFCLRGARRFHVYFLAVWAVSILVNNHIVGFVNTPELPRMHQVPFSEYSLSFVLGGLALHAVKSTRVLSAVRAVGPYWLAAMLAFAAWGFQYPFPAYTTACLSAVAVAYSFNTEFSWRSNFLMRLGNRSYGIYLIHTLICAWTLGLLAPNVKNPFVMYGLMVVLSVHVGSLLGDLEVAIYARLKNFRIGRRAQSQQAAGSPAQA